MDRHSTCSGIGNATRDADPLSICGGLLLPLTDASECDTFALIWSGYIRNGGPAAKLCPAPLGLFLAKPASYLEWLRAA